MLCWVALGGVGALLGTIIGSETKKATRTAVDLIHDAGDSG
ncbi:MAG: hypothetical protein ACREMI_08480 [Gemmatimonadales bacterium]